MGSQQQLGPGLGLGSGSDQNSGLNPAAAAAVAALSQLNQFAGNMDAAQRAMHPPVRAFNIFFFHFLFIILLIREIEN